MGSLVEIRNNEVVVSSRDVAEKFGKEHKHVLENIREIIRAENSALTFFQENTYKAGTGKSYPEYLMNRDGFTLLAMGFTGKEALRWKLKYIAAFNEMEERLKSGRLLSSSPARGGSKVKYYKGIAVITKKDLAAELGTQTTAVYYYTIKPGFMEKGRDYFTIGGTELAKFKKQNGMSKHCTALTIVTSSGVSKIYEAMGKEIETAAIQGPKDIAKAKFKKLPLEIQRRIETMAVDEELMDQYENAIMKLSGETASVVEDLLERYAELYHSYYSNEEKLTSDGIEPDKRLEYHKLYREAYGKGATA